MIDFGEHIPERKALDLTPMLDVVFLLLIFFMLTSVFAKPALLLDLPKAQSGERREESMVVVSLRSDGAVLLNSTEIDMISLGQKLEKIYATDPNLSFNIEADKSIEFGQVVALMDIARLAGARSIAVVTEIKK